MSFIDTLSSCTNIFGGVFRPCQTSIIQLFCESSFPVTIEKSAIGTLEKVVEYVQRQ